MRTRGFTLVEVMVALAIMALMAAMSWRAIDGMLRAQAATSVQSADLLLVQTTVSQWQADLDALVETNEVSALVFDGRFLRMTRRTQELDATGRPESVVRVVAWTIEDAGAEPAARRMLTRWTSPPVVTRDDVRREWARAISPDLAIRREAIAVAPARDWQIYFYRGDAWTNPQSAGDANRAAAPAGAVPATEAPPDGVRLILNLEGGALSSGGLTKDWVRPQWATARSS
jgi:general secretion pathway protein J